MADRSNQQNSDPELRSGDERVRALYEQAESQTAKAFEQLVVKPSFGVLMARSAENIAALSRIGADVADLMLRNLRIAGRADVTRLARQLHRTEDKLERVLQEIETLRDELRDRGGDPAGNGRRNAASAGNGGDSRRRTRRGPEAKR